jgi:hypothetical protein
MGTYEEKSPSRVPGATSGGLPIDSLAIHQGLTACKHEPWPVAATGVEIVLQKPQLSSCFNKSFPQGN